MDGNVKKWHRTRLLQRPQPQKYQQSSDIRLPLVKNGSIGEVTFFVGKFFHGWL